MNKVILVLITLCFIVKAEKPNVIYILADDLGYNEVGCYGQKKIRTPNLDKMALEGMRFTQHYSGSAVCAPSRCVLLTGKHTGKSFIRNNGEFGGGWHKDDAEGQMPIPNETLTVAEVFKSKGYATGAVGKWGLGGASSWGHPNHQGFDFYYGHLCQRLAHNFYQTHLWRNKRKIHLENDYFKAHQKFPKGLDPKDPKNYKKYQGKDFADDFMAEECLGFIKKNKDKPFFLYYASPIPHVALQVPDDSLKEYLGKFKETPYLGTKGYLPHYAPRACYAAMVTRFDKHIGQIMNLLKELKIDDNTIVMFSSDNGPTFNGGSDSAFFNSAGPFDGLKCSLKEGGVRVPFIVRWPNKIKAGSNSDHISAFDDFLPTICDLIKVPRPDDSTGLSFMNTLLGKEQKKKEAVYWEYGNQQALRMGDWKIYRRSNNKTGQIKSYLYNLKEDIAEQNDVKEKYPEILKKLINKTIQVRTPSAHFKGAWDKEQK
jgi:arylsulfatase A